MTSQENSPTVVTRGRGRLRWSGWRGRLVAGLSVVLMMLGMGLLVPERAAAVEPDQRILLAAGQANCTDYSEGQIWQTSTTWVRMRYRICLGESSDGRLVQPHVQVRGDWPIDCSLSAGFPIGVSLSCPLSRLGKRNRVTFHTYTTVNGRPAVFRIPYSITRPNGRTRTGWCSFQPRNVRENTTTWTGLESRNSFRCNGRVYKRLVGTYTVRALGVRGDVNDDGDGALIMPAGAMEFTSI